MYIRMALALTVALPASAAQAHTNELAVSCPRLAVAAYRSVIDFGCLNAMLRAGVERAVGNRLAGNLLDGSAPPRALDLFDLAASQLDDLKQDRNTTVTVEVASVEAPAGEPTPVLRTN